MSLAVDLADRRVLVTGAAGGLGHAIALRVGEAGAAVVVSDLDADAVESVAAGLADRGVRAVAIPADLAVAAADLPRRAAEALGGLDGLVNAAGVMRTTPLAETTREEWRWVVDLDLTAVFEVTRAAALIMAEDGGAVVSLASVAARSARPNAAHYAAAKAGVLSFTKSAAAAFAPTVRVNAVCPGVFLTPMWEAIIADREARFGAGAGTDYLDQLRATVPLGRDGQPMELANVVTFLLSDLASYVTGQALNVCGGLEMD